ncbi:hypothetical protein ABZW18_27165 [Streptomyces sp. NPDC004647]|uniref:hypothetical protein n=1 Tax=Streptomyces sp. NPDC004647 TaxID=3154671 RepID=UPI0033AA2738
MERASNPRGSNLRVIALASAVVLAVLLPLAAATAGPAVPGESGGRPQARAAAVSPAPSRSAAPAPGTVSRAGSADDTDTSADRPAPGKPAVAPSDSGLVHELGLSGLSDRQRRMAECGPELTSPEGVEAQTCVLSEGRDTWARTYYRNLTGSTLRAVLTQMRPDGRTVQVHCTLEAGDDPGACETPRTPGGAAGQDSAGESRSHGAVAEIASADSERLLLRSGSNSPSSASG